MTETDDEAPETTEHDRPARKRWRDDPLSIFLAGAAALLGLMYFLEQSSLENLQDAAARAHALGAGALDLDGCTVGSASTAGSALVVSCESTAQDAATRAASREPDLSGFEAVIFVGNDAQLACAPRPADWPDACEHRELPEPPEDARH